MVQIHAVPAFRDNYIWVLEDGRNAAAVDPGDAGPVEDFLERRGLSLTAVIGTHHHADHVGGLQALAGHWRGRRGCEKSARRPIHGTFTRASRRPETLSRPREGGGQGSSPP